MQYFTPHDSIDCGPTCLRMIANYYGRNFSLPYLRKICNINRLGVSIYSLGKAAELIGLKSTTAEFSLSYLREKAHLPCILYWEKNHFVVLYKIKRGKGGYIYYIADPGVGKIRLDESDILKFWLCGDEKGFGLFLEPTDELKSVKEDIDEANSRSIVAFLSQYFSKFRGNYFQVIFTMITVTFTSFLFPFLTQAIVDYGVRTKDLHFVVLVLGFQIFLFLTSTFADVIRSHLLLHISSRINLSILNDFLSKMMRLPLRFFESKLSGDLIQRVHDHTQLEEFITNSLLTNVFTLINLCVYSFILFYYSSLVFLIFLGASIITILWTVLFLRWRKSLDYKRFRELSNSSDKLHEMTSQMQEIKINQFESYKRREWEAIRVSLFKLELSKLSLEQFQRIGSDFFTQIRTSLILFFTVMDVIQGELTLGMMLSISYIVGQLNVPIKEIVRFINTAQTSSIALERMNEVYTEQDEGYDSVSPRYHEESNPDFSGIELKNVEFSYPGYDHDPVLRNVNLKIPLGKTTAIVGSSGSGKTTLLKLLLRFYPPTKGNIILNNKNLQDYPLSWWRSQTGVVMQEGHIFSDTISRNIIMGQESPENKRLVSAAGVANIEDFVLDLPLHFETKVGESGIGLSSGQKQRILIARAIYKSPSFLFFDEATSSLDASNERIIMDNLQNFSEGKTVLVIAHRLSTVKKADQIVVLEKGEIVEIGSHRELIEKKGRYFYLIQNQLELGI